MTYGHVCCSGTKKEEEEVYSSVDSESDQAESEEYQEDFEEDEEQQAAASQKNKVQSGSQSAVARKVWGYIDTKHQHNTLGQISQVFIYAEQCKQYTIHNLPHMVPAHFVYSAMHGDAVYTCCRRMWLQQI